MRFNSEEKEDKQDQITPPDSAQINTESFSHCNENDGQTSSAANLDKDSEKSKSIKDDLSNKLVKITLLNNRGAWKIRDENASVSSRIDRDRRNSGPYWGGLRRRRSRNATFISMDREIGIMNPSYRALRIRPQNSHDHIRNLRMRIGLTECPSRFRPQSDSGSRDESQPNTDSNTQEPSSIDSSNGSIS